MHEKGQTMIDSIHKPKDNASRRVTRLLKGDRSVRQVAPFGFVMGHAPDDGYLIETDSASSSVIYIRDADLDAARRARAETNCKTSIGIRGWE